MNKYAKLFEYFRQCPELANLWSIAATEKVGVRVILPQGASPEVSYEEQIDALGNYQCNIIPFPSVYEDFQINCYEWYDVKDNTIPSENMNVLTLEEVLRICDWIKEQDNQNNFPEIGEDIISIEPNPFVPQIRYINQEENIVGYFITVRLRYVNKKNRKFVEYEY